MSKNKILIILFFSLVIGWQLLRPGYYSMHDDLQIMRLYEMNRCFENGQIPCRFVPDLGQNYGQPLYNYYSAFPYYLGQLIHLSGISYIDTTKLLFLLSLFLSGVFIYFLAAEFFSVDLALIAATAYMVAPYHAVDIFVRGALAESWGLTLVPLLLLAIVKVCRQPKSSHAIFLALSLAVFLTTHNITVLISAPLFIPIGLYFFMTNNHKSRQLRFLISGSLLGIGLSAFFLLPVLLERNLIQTNFLITDYFDFRAHFVTLSQLFTKFSWGYGPSRFNSFQYPQTLSFFVGVIPIISLIITPVILFLARKNKKAPLALFSLIYFLTLFSLFMTHSRSVLIWDKVSALAFVQFPWRFLGPVTLLSSLLIAFDLDYFLKTRPKPEKIIAFVLAFLLAVNFAYFRFEKYFPTLTDNQKLTGTEYDNQIKGALLDYLPLASKQIPSAKAPATVSILSGTVDINYFDKRSNYFSSEFDVLSASAIVQFPVTYFPGWVVYQNRNGTPIKFDLGADYGQITVKLTKGHQLIQAFFENTPIRSIGNLATYLSALVLITWLVSSFRHQNEN